MRKSLLEIYALLVCLFAVGYIMMTAGTLAFNLVRVASPETTLPAYQFNQMESNEAYIQGLYGDNDDNEKQLMRKKPAGEITRAREEYKTLTLAGEKRNAFRDLLQNGIELLISLFIFWLHWKLAARERRNNS